MRNIIVSINVGFREIEDLATENDGVERMDDGSFRMVLDHQAEFNIDRLENALLQTSYPALRKALSDHLERASKKTRMANLAGARREVAIFALNFRKTGCKTAAIPALFI